MNILDKSRTRRRAKNWRSKETRRRGTDQNWKYFEVIFYFFEFYFIFEYFSGNPLLQNDKKKNTGVKRRWDDDVVFKNCARQVWVTQGSADRYKIVNLGTGKEKEFCQRYNSFGFPSTIHVQVYQIILPNNTSPMWWHRQPFQGSPDRSSAISLPLPLLSATFSNIPFMNFSSE